MDQKYTPSQLQDMANILSMDTLGRALMHDILSKQEIANNTPCTMGSNTGVEGKLHQKQSQLSVCSSRISDENSAVATRSFMETVHIDERPILTDDDWESFQRPTVLFHLPILNHGPGGKYDHITKFQLLGERNPIPAQAFAALPNLTSILLTDCSLQSFPSGLPAASLVEIRLIGNEIRTLPDSETMASFEKLEILDVSRNRIPFIPHDQFWPGSSVRGPCPLQYLDLSGNLLRELPYSIGTLNSLGALILDGNPFTRSWAEFASPIFSPGDGGNDSSTLHCDTPLIMFSGKNLNCLKVIQRLLLDMYVLWKPFVSTFASAAVDSPSLIEEGTPDISLKFYKRSAAISKPIIIDSIRREHILNELLSTEQTYVSELSNLVKIYAGSPLEKSLFGILECAVGVLASHQKYILPSFKQASLATCFGATFLKLIPLLRIYPEYYNKYFRVVDVLSQWKGPNCHQKLPKQRSNARHSTISSSKSWMSSNDIFFPSPVSSSFSSSSSLSTISSSSLSSHSIAESVERYLVRAKNHPSHTQIDLSAFLILPVQRLPRYRLFLEELLCCSDPTTPDYPHLNKACKDIEALIQECNERLRRHEERRCNAAVIGQIRRHRLSRGYAFLTTFMSGRRYLGEFRLNIKRIVGLSSGGLLNDLHAFLGTSALVSSTTSSLSPGIHRMRVGDICQLTFDPSTPCQSFHAPSLPPYMLGQRKKTKKKAPLAWVHALFAAPASTVVATSRPLRTIVNFESLEFCFFLFSDICCWTVRKAHHASSSKAAFDLIKVIQLLPQSDPHRDHYLSRHKDTIRLADNSCVLYLFGPQQDAFSRALGMS